jgi:hypothetical protein
MRIPFHAWIVCGIMGACPALWAQSPLPTPRKPEDRPFTLEDRTALAKARASEAARMEGISFGEECVTVSEPANRLLYHHELNVTGFLSIASKLGRGRVMLFVHLSNPRLATHGGVFDSLGFLRAPWNENGHSYTPSSCWGMIGDLDQPKPHAYLFRLSPKLNPDAKTADTPKAGTDMEASALNRFEEHALALLQKGEKLVRWECKESMHAVGAIRAEAQCLRCHDNRKAGDLLGAFTYSFTKSKAVPPNEKTQRILTLNQEGKTPFQIARALDWAKQPDQLEISGIYIVRETLLKQGVVTAEMLTDQALWRKQALETDLGPLKKPHAPAGGE